MSRSLVIGEVALRTGVPAKTIRYYEEAGLIPRARRAGNGYRVYDDRSVDMLRFVRRARDLGFAVRDVGELLALWADETRASSSVKALANRHLDEIERKIKELKTLRGTLRQLVARCHGDEQPGCPILDDLAGQDEERTS